MACKSCQCAPKKKALFLDRDGVIIEDKHYVNDPKNVKLIANVGDALFRAQRAGYLLFIVSNQGGVGKGIITMEQCIACFDETRKQLAGYKVFIKETYFAPEAPDDPNPIGRKPLPYFVNEACEKYDIDKTRSYFIGDRLSDLECGFNAGLGDSILVRTGYGAKNEAECVKKFPHLLVVNDLDSAVDVILGDL